MTSALRIQGGVWRGGFGVSFLRNLMTLSFMALFCCCVRVMDCSTIPKRLSLVALSPCACLLDLLGSMISRGPGEEVAT